MGNPTATSASTSVLGATTPEEFLTRYWQREPLLIRGALPDYVSPFSPDELAGLATDEDVESRLVIENVAADGANSHWQLRHGPFTDADFAQLPPTNWSLLVQAVDLWVPDAQALLDEFDFLPRWRMDDIMASFAPRGGSVGPHFDQYDVFLLQVEGERLWQIGQSCDEQTALLPGNDLSIVDGFVATQEWLLAPGDMLYLPPKLAHWGVAQTNCLTYSIGFRSPTLADMLGDLAVELGALDASTHYVDPALTPAMASDTVDAAFVQHAKAQLLGLLDNDALIADWFARYMTRPKYPGLEEVTEEERTAQALGRRYRNGELGD